MPRIWLFQCLTFLAAFLLFQIELITAKLLLPRYGGSYQVWGACVVFFQLLLFLGYIFTHKIAQKVSPANFRHVFLGLIILPLFFFPGRNLIVHESNLAMPMSIDVFILLLISVGPVFFVLSTLTVMTQVWLSYSELKEKSNPYTLYAVSNIGSLGALLTYPFLFETFLGLSSQIMIWRVLYLLLVGIFIILYSKISKLEREQTKEKSELLSVSWTERIRWGSLSAAGVVLFLSVTNILTYEICPFPLLWILPLAIYLLAYVCNFKQKPWCPHWIINNISILLGCSVLLFALNQLRIVHPFIYFVFYIFILFILCMYCQNQLIVFKPKDNNKLTQFYVTISFGGFLGGFLTSWIIPLISTTTTEYFVGLTLLSVNLVLDKDVKRVKFESIRVFIYVLMIYMFGPILYENYKFGSIFIFTGIVIWAYKQLDDNKNIVALTLFCFIFLWSSIEPLWTNRLAIYSKRNYYGIYNVVDRRNVRFLMHGVIMHGGQLFGRKLLRTPALYYTRTSEIGEYTYKRATKVKKVGLVGLGAGALLTYFKENQEISIYELDPEIVHIAKNYFTYIDNFKGKLDIFVGDARIIMERQKKKEFDCLYIDAFSGDSIPTHLLTLEGLKVFQKHLSQNGVMLFHISNNYINLRPVLAKNGQILNAHVAHVKSKTRTPYGKSSYWMIISWDANALKDALKVMKLENTQEEAVKNFRPWTDDYSNLMAVLY